MIDVNIRGVLNGIAAVLPAVIKQNSGHIVNVSSIAGIHVFLPAPVYAGTRFAVEAISEGLRMEVSLAHGIRVTVVRPGGTATNLTSTITDQKVTEWIKALPPLRSMPMVLPVMEAELLIILEEASGPSTSTPFAQAVMTQLLVMIASRVAPLELSGLSFT